MQAPFPHDLRLLTSLETLNTPGTSSLIGVNTNELPPDCLVMVRDTTLPNMLYVLHKSDNTTPQNLPNIVVPNAGPGRWFAYGRGAGFNQLIAVPHAAIPPQSTIDAPATVVGVNTFADIIVFDLVTSTLPAGVIITTPLVTGPNAATFRFGNLTAATIAAGTTSLEVAVLSA